MSMPSKDTRFIAGEDIKAGEIVKYTEEFGIVRHDSQVCPGDAFGGPRLVSQPRTSPYNAKPVPRFEVSEVQVGQFATQFKVTMFVDGREVDFNYVPRTWFRRNQERAIKKTQLHMAEDWRMSRRLSGSAETLTGVKLDV